MLAALRYVLIAALLAWTVPTAGPLQAQPARRIAVVVDTSEATASAFNLVRPAIGALIAGLPAEAEILLASTGRRVQVRLPPTTDRKKAADSAKGLTSDGGATVLMDGLREIDERFMRGAGDRRAFFVILTGDGSESSVRTDGPAFNDWLRTLAPRGVGAYAVVLKTGNGLPEVVANAVVQATGGRCETVGNAGLLREKMEALAAQLSTGR